MRFGFGGACLVGMGFVGCHLITDVDDLQFGDSSTSTNTGGNGGAGPTSVSSVGGSGATGGFSSSSSAGGTIGVIPAPDAYWSFDGLEPRPTENFVVPDQALPMNGLDLTCTKGVKGVEAGHIAGSVDFDGNDSVHCARSHAKVVGTALQLEGNKPFSMSVWWNTAEGDGGTLVSKKKAIAPFYGFVLGISINDDSEIQGTLGLVLAKSEGSPKDYVYVRSKAQYDDGNWHHAVVVYSGSTNAEGVSIYVDGKSLPAADLVVASDGALFSGDIDAVDVPFMIGRQGKDEEGGEKAPYTGQLDDIAIWKGLELTANHAAEIHSEGMAKKPLSELWPTEL